MENSIVKIGVRKINYQILNLEYLDRNTCLVFLHDALGSIKQWKDFPLKLSNDLKLPALLSDRSGHGESSESKKKRDKKFFHNESDFLKILLEKLNINIKVILVGCSDGGTISLVHAAKYAGDVCGIITIAAHTFVEDITLIGVNEFKVKYENGKIKNILSKYHSEKTDNLFYSWSELWLSKKFRNWNIFSELKKIKCPVLSIQGDKDEYGTAEQLNTIRENVKSDCTIKLIKDAGHFPHMEKEKEIIKLIGEFVNEKPSGFFESPRPV